MQMSLKADFAPLIRKLTYVQKQQVPFAASRAINDIAKDSQQAIQQHIRTVYKNRKIWWLQQQPTGIKVRFSSKRNLKSSVFTKAYFAQLQETGGTKTPRRGRALAIPTAKTPRKFHKSGGARAILRDDPKAFSAGRAGIFRRVGKNKVVRVFGYANKASVKPALNFERIARATAQSTGRMHFERRLREALATAR